MREFSIVQSTVVDHQGLYRNLQKMGVVAEIFLLKALEGGLHLWQKLSITPSVFIDTSTHTHNLSDEGLGYNYERLKS